MNAAELVDVDANPVAWREARPTGGTDEGLVLLLHGLGGSRVAWDHQLTGLAAEGWRAVAWDMPGYGASAPVSSLSFPDLADAVTELVDVLDADRVHLVGLSFGGMVAQHVALDHPRRVDRLVLVDTSPAFGFDGTTDAGRWVADRLGPLDDGETPASIAHRVLETVAGPGAPRSVVDEAAAAMARIDPDGLRAAVRCLVTHDLRDRLHRITAPTLVVVGALDTETPPAYSRHLAERIPQSTYVEVDGAGHLLPHERPDVLTGLLVDFFRSNPRSQRMDP